MLADDARALVEEQGRADWAARLCADTIINMFFHPRDAASDLVAARKHARRYPGSIGIIGGATTTGAV
jgi:hypothetical protein